MRALDELVRDKGNFGRQAAARTADLLDVLRGARLTAAADLIALHETALFLRAFPQSARVLRAAEAVLDSFGARVRDADALGNPEISGMAGTYVSTNWSYEFAQRLVARHGRAVRIDWENYERQDRLGAALARLLPGAAEAWSVEPHIDWRAWFEAVRGTPQWLLEKLDARSYDALEMPLRWDIGESSGSRTRGRFRRREIFYHTEAMIARRDVSIEQEFAAPRIKVRTVGRAEATQMMGEIIDASAVRYRELWGFVHPDARMYHADFGRGVDYFFFGVAKEWKLPLRGYHAGMFFRNGVPIGYFEGLTLFERMEAGFNLYYTFRDGEAAWLYAKLLKLYRERAGVRCFTVDPYQIGHENEEAIASGAFWFYRKLGFRSARAEVAGFVEHEERRIAADAAYRTPAATLRKLAESPLIYGEGDEWGHFSIEVAARKIDAKGAGFLTKLRKSKDARRILLRLGTC